MEEPGKFWMDKQALANSYRRYRRLCDKGYNVTDQLVEVSSYLEVFCLGERLQDLPDNRFLFIPILFTLVA